MIFDKKWWILIKKESENLDFTGLEITRDYYNNRREFMENKRNKRFIFLGLVVVVIALLIFWNKIGIIKETDSNIEKSEAYDKVIKILHDYDQNIENFATIAVCVDSRLLNDVDSKGDQSWKFILYDSSKNLMEEIEQSVYVASVDLSGKVEYVGQGQILNSLLKTNIEQNGKTIKVESSNSFALPNLTQMYLFRSNSTRYFNRVDCIEKDEIERIEVYDINLSNKSKMLEKTVSVKNNYFLLDMIADGNSYEWTQEKGWINKKSGKEVQVDTYTWEVLEK